MARVELGFFGFLANLIMVLVTYMIYFQIRDWKPVQTVFFCHDPNLSHPFKPSIVSWDSLEITYYVVPAVVILVTELVLTYSLKSTWGSRFGRVFNVYLLYIFGSISSQTICEFVKKVTGRLRPQFFETCKPLFKENCNKNPFQFITDYECKGNEMFNDPLDEAEQSHQSFVSGHAVAAAQMAAFLSLYMQYRYGRKIYGPNFVYLFIQFITWTWAFYVSITRLIDHHHFTEDIAFGFALGVLVQYVVVRFTGKELLEDEEDEDLEQEIPAPKAYQTLI